MARDFGVTNKKYKKALSDMRDIELTTEHLESVKLLLAAEDARAALAIKNQQVSEGDLHRRFNL